MITTAQAFTNFVSRISLTEVQKQEVRNKRTKTEGYLRGGFPESSTLPVKRVVLIGSADRGTTIRPLDDIDVMAEFNNKDKIFEKYRYDSIAFLQRIRTALQGQTSIANIGSRGQAVRLFYTSGAHVDIAPTFRWTGGGFALPSGDGKWITTDPERQAEWLTERRQVLGAHLTPIIKVAKRWNRVHSSHLSSYHVEVLTAVMFRSLGSNYREAMKCWFDWAPRHLSVSDPAGHSGALDSALSASARSALKTRLGEAKNRAENAIAYENAGNHAEAKRLWKIELGDEFAVS